MSRARRPSRSRFQVCSFWHDHPLEDPSYADCEHAADAMRQRIASEWRCACGAPATCSGGRIGGPVEHFCSYHMEHGL